MDKLESLSHVRSETDKLEGLSYVNF